jgi:hypothetical protein
MIATPFVLNPAKRGTVQDFELAITMKKELILVRGEELERLLLENMINGSFNSRSG